MKNFKYYIGSIIFGIFLLLLLVVVVPVGEKIFETTRSKAYLLAAFGMISFATGALAQHLQNSSDK